MASASTLRTIPQEHDLDRALAAVRTSLRRDYGAAIPAGALDALVDRFAEDFADATVRDYLGILIERRCRQTLGAVATTAARN